MEPVQIIPLVHSLQILMVLDIHIRVLLVMEPLQIHLVHPMVLDIHIRVLLVMDLLQVHLVHPTVLDIRTVEHPMVQ